MTDDTDLPELSDQSIVEEARRRRLEDAKKAYEQATNRLWAGNAAGMFAVLGAFTTGKVQGFAIFAALCSFMLGLFLLTIGTFCSLISQARVIRELENVDSLLDMVVHRVRRPSEEAGFTFYNVQTFTSIVSAILLFVGVGFGVYYVVQIIIGT